MKLIKLLIPNRSANLEILRFIHKKNVVIYNTIKNTPLIFISMVPLNKMKTSHRRTVPVGTII